MGKPANMKVSNTEGTAGRRNGIQESTIIIQLFPRNKRLVPASEMKPNLKCTTEKHLQAGWKKLGWKRCLETNESNLLAQKIWRAWELGCQMLPSFQKTFPFTLQAAPTALANLQAQSRLLLLKGKLNLWVELPGTGSSLIT